LVLQPNQEMQQRLVSLPAAAAVSEAQPKPAHPPIPPEPQAPAVALPAPNQEMQQRLVSLPAAAAVSEAQPKRATQPLFLQPAVAASEAPPLQLAASLSSPRQPKRHSAMGPGAAPESCEGGPSPPEGQPPQKVLRVRPPADPNLPVPLLLRGCIRDEGGCYIFKSAHDTLAIIEKLLEWRDLWCDVAWRLIPDDVKERRWRASAYTRPESRSLADSWPPDFVLPGEFMSTIFQEIIDWLTSTGELVGKKPRQAAAAWCHKKLGDKRVAMWICRYGSYDHAVAAAMQRDQ